MKSATESGSRTGWIRFLRIQDWFYLLGISGLVLVRNLDRVDPWMAVRVLAFSSLFLCWGYVFNNTFDQHEDSIEKNGFKTSGRSTVTAVTMALTAVLLVVAFLWRIHLPTFLVMGLNVAYSAPPIRLKRFLASSLAANGVFFGFVAYASSQLIHGEVVGGELAFAGFVAALFLPLQYVHHLEHRECEGLQLAFVHRFTSALLFLVLLCVSFFLQFAMPVGFVYLMTAYGAAGASLALSMQSPRETRIHLRWLSAVFGTALFALVSARWR